VGIGSAWWLGALQTRCAVIYGVAIATMGLLGLLDDLYGSREVGGFRGHFRRLFGEGRITTGAVKAIGGGVVALWLGARISGGDVLQWFLATGLIALSANTLNLLDLRPGRASVAFFVGIAIAAGFGLKAPWAAAAICLPAAIGYLWDRKGLAMMGDVGSNALGAALGVTLALSLPAWAQIMVLSGVILLNAYSEKRSITEAIERHPILRAIDRLTGVR